MFVFIQIYYENHDVWSKFCQKIVFWSIFGSKIRSVLNRDLPGIVGACDIAVLKLGASTNFDFFLDADFDVPTLIFGYFLLKFASKS